MATKNYYVVQIDGISSKYKTFSILREAKKYVIDNYPYYRAQIVCRA